MARVHMERFVKELEKLCATYRAHIYQDITDGCEHTALVLSIGAKQYEVLSISQDMNIEDIREVDE